MVEKLAAAFCGEEACQPNKSGQCDYELIVILFVFIKDTFNLWKNLRP